MPSFIVPPGGPVGFNSMTWASRLALGGGRASTSKRRGKRRKTKANRSKKTARRSKGARKMKFGSPAWQKKYKVGKFAKKR